MALLTIAYVGLTFLDEEGGSALPSEYLLVFPAIFVAEFVVRLVDSRDRARYVRQHWIDAVTAIPLLGVLRALRLLRLLRLLGVIRLIATVDHLGAGKRERTSFWFLGPLLILLWAGAAYAFWVLEHGSNPAMRAFPDAVYMAFGAATTFGYANVQPVTPGGRILAGLLIFVGIGLVTFASSQITAAFLHQRDPVGSLRDDLVAIRQQLDELKALVAKTEDDLEAILPDSPALESDRSPHPAR